MAVHTDKAHLKSKTKTQQFTPLPLPTQDRIDYAIALHVYAGGFLPLFQIIAETKHDRVLSTAADLAACCMRNNEKCQQWALEVGGLATLHKAHTNLELSADVRAKVLGAVSSLVQNNEAAEAAFLASGGVAVLVHDLKGIGRRLKVKSLFMLQWLLASSAAARTRALGEDGEGLADLLESSVQDEDDEIAELGAMSLATMIKESKGFVGDVEKLKGAVEQRMNVRGVAQGESESTYDALKELKSMLWQL